jgi:DNA polymerase-3 subunit alpha
MNRRVLESLIKAGALDSLGERATLLHNVNRILALAQREQRLRETGQATMFDLWGEAVATPMSSLELEAATTSTREKLVWEKELLGVYLSEHPFSQFADKPAPENTTLCGQIDAEMVGQTVRVAGMVASLHLSFTRERQTFASATLEDLTGSIEVMVWPKVYANTKDLWQEGNILLVEGKLRLRDDRLQLSCDSVRRYQPQAAPAEEAVAAPPQPVEEAPAVEEPVAAPPPQSCCLVITITQTADEASDAACLHKVIDALKDFPGQDVVKLRISNEEKIINLKLANVSVGYCPELHQRLVALVGEKGLQVGTVS